MIKKILKIIAYLIGLWIFILVIITGVTQTKLFKDCLRVFLSTTLEENLNANINLGTIRGNFITSFSIDSLSIYSGDEHFLSTGKISLHHDPFTIWYKTLTIRAISVEKPFVSILKSNDSLWNIKKIFKPSKDTSAASKFDWTIKFEDIKIVDGRFVICDSLDTKRRIIPDTLTNYLNYRKFNVEGINIRFSGLLKQHQYKLNVREFSAKLENTNFLLNQMSGQFELTNNLGRVSNLVIMTGNSNIRIDAEISQFNLFKKFSLESLKDSPLKLKLHANNIDLTELKSFIPQIFFLNGTAYADLEASGKFGELEINRLNLSTYNSLLKASGIIKNLDIPKELFLDVKIVDSKITPPDVSKLLPFFNIPEFSDIEDALISISYTGKPVNFKSKINLSSNTGNILADLYMNLEKKPMSYKCNLITNKLNPEKITGNSNLNGSINSIIDIEGEGTNLDNLLSTLKVKVDSSLFFGLTINNADIVTRASRRSFEGSISINSNSFKGNLEGKMDLKEIGKPNNNFKFSINSLDLSRFFKDNRFKSDLNFNGVVSAIGKNIGDITGNLNLNLFPSTIGKYDFKDENISVSLNQSTLSEKNLIFQSSFIELDLNGNFLLTEIPATISNITENFIKAVKSRFDDTDTESTILSPELTTKPPILNTADYEFLLTINDLSPIATILDKKPFNYQGTITGNIKNQSDKYTSFSGEINFKDFYMGSAGEGFLLSGGKLIYELDSLTQTYLFENFNGNIRGKIDKVKLNKSDFDNINLALDYNDLIGNFSFGCIMDKILLNVDGNIDIFPKMFSVNFDKFDISLDAYKWQNTSEVKFVLNPSGLSILDFTIDRNNKEKLSVSGDLLFDGSLNVKGNIKDFDIDGARYVLKNLNLTQNLEGLNGILNTDINLSGNTKAPIISISTGIDNIIYQNTNFGNLKGILNYKERLANLNIELNNKKYEEQKPDFKINGYFPIDLAFAKIEQRFPDEEVNLTIVSDSFQLSLLNPLIPVMPGLKGILLCNVLISGTPANPIYFGNIEILKTRFVLNTNNIAYNINGVLKPEQNKIKFETFTISNDKNDYSDGKFTISGYFNFKDFNIDYFDIHANGQLLLLKETQQKGLQNIQGRLVGVIGKDGLHYTGKFIKSHLSGNVQIKEASLVFPPLKGTTYYDSGNNIRYVVIDDTTKINNVTNLRHQFYHSEHGISDTLETKQKRESKIWQGLSYDITLETRGTSNIRLVFNPSTNEELYAELDGKINLQRQGGKNYTIGEISISDRSYYNFFKRFDASGELKFLGEADNPEFDIKATYTGYRKPPVVGTDTNVVEQKVVITLNITGDRIEPNLKMNISIDDRDYSEVIQGGDLQSDAISFLFTGKFRDDLTTREKSDIVSNLGSSAGKSILTGATATMLSGILTDFLRKEFSFIRSAEITYSGGNVQQSADLRLSGQIFNAYWRFGGKVFDDINNANFSFILNFGDLFEAPSIRNLYLEMERKVDGSDISIDKKFTNSARIYYKWSF